MVSAMRAYHIAWFSISAVVALCFLTAILRRWFYLREKLNTFWVLALSECLFIPTWCLNYSAYLDQSPTSQPSPIFISVTFWAGYMGYAINAAFILATLLRFTSWHKLTTQRQLHLPPLPLFLLCLTVVVTGLILAVFAGMPDHYAWAERTLLAETTFYALCILVLVLWKRHQIGNIINNYSNTQETPRTGKQEAPWTLRQLARVRKALAMYALFHCFFMGPAVVILILHCVFLSYIDQHVWSTILLWSFYRGICMVHTMCMAAFYTYETQRRLSAQPSSSSATDSSLSDRPLPAIASTYAGSTTTGIVTVNQSIAHHDQPESP